MNNLLIATTDPEFEAAAFTELRAADPKLIQERILSPGILLLSSRFDFDTTAALIATQEPVFLRHIAPAILQMALLNTEQDLSTLVEAIKQLPELPETAQFAVQVRFIEKPEARPYTPFALKEAIAQSISHAQENIKEPEWIYSICCTPNEAYLGLSETAQNLSSWAGGERRYARDSGQISRAEFKLLEALEVFGLELPENGLVLDLGAAPGGWSRVFMQHGLGVIAVDPAELDPRVAINPNLEHYKGHADTFLQLGLEKGYTFDIIANDMRMDARQAAEFMVKFAPLLKKGGFAISTLKLPHAAPKLDPVNIMRQALAIMSKGYRQVRARQLFHNRQEVTVILL